MMRLLAAVLLIGTPAAASAQLKPSDPEAIAAAVADCWTAVGPKTVDTNVLGRNGWQAGSISDAQGGQVDTPLQVYGKRDSEVVVMLMPTTSSPACTVTARVSSASDVSLAAQAVQRGLTGAHPQVKTARSGRSIVFIALPKIAMLDATGSKAQPGVRVVVSFRSGERG